MAHDTCRCSQGGGQDWVLTRGDARWEGAPPVRARANSPELLLRLARLGSGIVAVNDHFAEPYVQAGELVPLLVDWFLPSTPAWAVFPGRRLMPARTRVFLDALQAEFSGPRCQAAEEQGESLRQERIRQLRRGATVDVAD